MCCALFLIGIFGASCSDDEAPEDDGCPSEPPEYYGDCSVPPSECTYGEECCHGSCYDTIVCECTDGTWECYHTDACLGQPLD